MQRQECGTTENISSLIELFQCLNPQTLHAALIRTGAALPCRRTGSLPQTPACSFRTSRPFGKLNQWINEQRGKENHTIKKLKLWSWWTLFTRRHLVEIIGRKITAQIFLNLLLLFWILQPRWKGRQGKKKEQKKCQHELCVNRQSSQTNKLLRNQTAGCAKGESGTLLRLGR